MNRDQIVVRFGEMKTADLRTGAETAFALNGAYALSFWSLPNHSAESLALQVAIKINRRGGSFRVSTLGRMSDAGFDLQDPRPDGHWSLVLGDAPDEAVCTALRAAFDDLIPSPYR